MLNNNYIGTEHLLLGLVREGDGLAGRVLAKLGVELEQARKAVARMQDDEAEAGRRTKPAPLTPPPDPWAAFGESVRHALDLAEDEAQERGQTYLTTEHLLLGILAARGGRAARALTALGADLDRLRDATASRCRVARPPHEEDTVLSPALSKAFTMAYEEQRTARASKVEAEHLLLGVVREPDGVAGRVLDLFGITARGLREALGALES